jgi:hypothetical protein
LCLTLRLPLLAAPAASAPDLAAPLAHLCNAVNRISEVAGVSRPLIVIVDTEDQPSARGALQQLADDSGWHQGDWALYICPVLLPLSADAKDGDRSARWLGPRTAAELAVALLQPTVVKGSELPDITDITVREVADVLSGSGLLTHALKGALKLDDKTERLARIRALGEAELVLSAASINEAQSS